MLGTCLSVHHTPLLRGTFRNHLVPQLLSSVAAFVCNRALSQTRSSSVGRMTPQEVIVSFERHSTCEVNLGLATKEESSVRATTPMLARIRSLNPSMAEVTEALGYLAKSSAVFSEGQRREIGQVVQSTMADPHQTKRQSTVSKTQQNLSLEHYLPAGMWGCLESEDRIDNKFRQLAQFMCTTLGLRNPDAKTKRLAVVIVHLASSVAPDPTHAYNDLCLFGAIMDQKRGSFGGRQLMSTYPATPKEFMDAHPGAYAPSDPPIDSRLDNSAILERCRKDVTPIRSSNEKLKKVRITSKGPDRDHELPALHHPADSVNGALLSMLEKYMLSRPGTPFAVDPPVARGGSLSSVIKSEASPVASRTSSSPSPSSMHSPVGGGSSTHLVFADLPAAQVQGGGIQPACLNPVHDKLKALQEKLGCLESREEGLLEDEVQEPLPRLIKKRVREVESMVEEAAEDEGEGSIGGDGESD